MSRHKLQRNGQGVQTHLSPLRQNSMCKVLQVLTIALHEVCATIKASGVGTPCNARQIVHTKRQNGKTIISIHDDHSKPRGRGTAM